MNSIIEAQETLEDEQFKELERCLDYRYFANTYLLINGKQAQFAGWQFNVMNNYLKGKNPLGLKYRRNGF